MNILLVNGSPHKEGCTYTALQEVADTLNHEGVKTDLFWIGNKPLSGCIACKTCSSHHVRPSGRNHCHLGSDEQIFWINANAHY